MAEILRISPIPPPPDPDVAGGRRIQNANPLALDNARTGEDALEEWEKDHGDTNVPTYLRKEGKTLTDDELKATNDNLGS